MLLSTCSKAAMVAWCCAICTLDMGGASASAAAAASLASICCRTTSLTPMLQQTQLIAKWSHIVQGVAMVSIRGFATETAPAEYLKSSSWCADDRISLLRHA